MYDSDVCLIVWLKMWNERPAHMTPSVWYITGTQGKQKIKCFLIIWPFEHKSTGKWLREYVPTFWETSRGVLSLGYTSVPHLGPSDMSVVYKPTKVMIFQPQYLTYLTKKKKMLSEHHLISLWNLDFLWVFHKAGAWQVAAYFGNKSPNCIFIADICFKGAVPPPPPAASFPQNQSQVILVTLCLYLKITAPNIDANIFFSLSKTPPTLTLWLSSFLPLRSFWQGSPFLSKGVFSWPSLPYRLDWTKGLLSRCWKKIILTPSIPTLGRICAGEYVQRLSGPDFPRTFSLIFWGALICPLGSGQSQTRP